MTIQRKKPIQKKRAKPRSFRSPRCDTRGCTKKAEVFWCAPHTSDVDNDDVPDHNQDRMCKSHARSEALRRWSLAVRTGKCEMAVFHKQHGVRCAGVNVAGHGFGKGAYPSVMFELWNGFSKCSGLNAYVESRTLEWDGYLREVWGDDYESRRQQALAVRKYDLGEVLASLSKYAR